MSSFLPLFALFFVLGVYLGAWVPPLYFFLVALLVLLPGRRTRAAPLAALALCLGALSLSVRVEIPPDPLHILAQEGPLPVSLEGRVRAGPYPAFAVDGAERRRLELMVERVGPAPGKEGAWQEVAGGVRLTLEAVPPGLAVGDRVRVEGSLSPLPSPQNPTDVDARERLMDAGISAMAYGRSIAVLGRSEARGMEWARARASRVLDRVLTGEARAVIGALVLGEPGSLPPELRARFAATGTAHLLAVSGGHVVIIAFLIQLCFGTGILLVPFLARRCIPGRVAASASIPVVWAYVAFVGAPPSALRAGIAACVVFFLKAIGRKISSLDLIALSALLALSYEPFELFGPSMQLSFAAVLGLCLFSPPLRRGLLPLLERLEKGSLSRKLLGGVLELGIATVAASLATAPIVAWHFQQAAPFSLLANVVLVPLISFLLLPVGLLAALCAVLGATLLAEAGFLAVGFAWEQMGVLLFWLSPARPTDLPLSTLSALFFYLLLLPIFFLRGRARLFLAAAVIFSWSAATLLPEHLGERSLRATFLSVGQGDGAVIELPESGAVVIDAGGQVGGHDDPGARVVIPFLRYRGIREIDLMVLSHPHPDHFGGLASVAEEIPVRRFWTNGGASTDPRYQRLVEATRSAQTASPQDGPDPYAAFLDQLGGASFTFLGPARHGTGRPYEDENNNSLVFRLSYGGRSILFTGDAEREAELEMVASGVELSADVLKVGHHGSRTSSTPELLDAVRPSVAVVSLGRKNRYGFPHPEVAARYQERKIPLWRTDEGAVTVEISPEGVRVRRWKGRSFSGELWPFIVAD